MKSFFRPSQPPAPAILDDHRELLRSFERRKFIKGGLSLGALSMLTGCDVAAQPSVDRALRMVSSFNDGIQAFLFDPSKLAPTYPASMVQKPPRFNAYYDVEDVKRIDGKSWRLELSGLIADRRSWNLDNLAALPQRDEIIRHVCVEGWDSGVPLRTFLETVGADLSARYVAFHTADDYPSCIDMASALHPQTGIRSRTCTTGRRATYPIHWLTQGEGAFREIEWWASRECDGASLRRSARCEAATANASSNGRTDGAMRNA